MRAWIACVLALGCKVERDPPAPAPSRPATIQAVPSRVKPAPAAPAAPEAPAQDQWDLTAAQIEHQRFMAEVDTNNDGEVSDDEHEVDRYQRAERLRRRYDLDGDGTLTTKEVGGGKPISMAKAILGDPDVVDANGDGIVSTEEIEVGVKFREDPRKP